MGNRKTSSLGSSSWPRSKISADVLAQDPCQFERTAILNSTVFWIATLIGVFGSCLLGCAPERSSAYVAEDYLRWFPEDTETLVVTQGPFTIPAEEPNPPYDLIR